MTAMPTGHHADTSTSSIAEAIYEAPSRACPGPSSEQQHNVPASRFPSALSALPRLQTQNLVAGSSTGRIATAPGSQPGLSPTTSTFSEGDSPSESPRKARKRGNVEEGLNTAGSSGTGLRVASAGTVAGGEEDMLTRLSRRSPREAPSHRGDWVSHGGREALLDEYSSRAGLAPSRGEDTMYGDAGSAPGPTGHAGLGHGGPASTSSHSSRTSQPRPVPLTLHSQPPFTQTDAGQSAGAWGNVTPDLFAARRSRSWTSSSLGRTSGLKELWNEVPLWSAAVGKTSPGGRPKPSRLWGGRGSRNSWPRVTMLLGLTILVWMLWVWSRADISFSGYVNPDLFTGRSPNSARRTFEPSTAVVPEHGFSELISLPSSIDPISSSAPSVNVLIHVATADKLASLEYLISTLSRQTYIPSNLSVICPRLLTSSCQSALDRVFIAEDVPDALNPRSISIASYPDQATPTTVILQTGIDSGQDLTLFVESTARDAKFRDGLELGKGWLANLIRAAGTAEYGGSIVGNSGVLFDSSKLETPKPNHRTSTCHIQKPGDVLADYTPADARQTKLANGAKNVHIPTAPFLLQTAWLQVIVSDVRSDLPPAAALSASLWSKAKIPAFAIPFGGSRMQFQEHLLVTDSPGEAFTGLHESYIEGAGLEAECLDLIKGIRASVGGESAVAKVFERRTTQRGTSHTESSSSDGGDGGRIAVFAGSAEDLDYLKPLVCGLTRWHEVTVYLTASDSHVDRLDFMNLGGCELSARTFGSGVAPVRIAEHLGKGGAPQSGTDVAIYLKGSVGIAAMEGMRLAGALFDRAASKVRPPGTLTAIGLPRLELEFVDWMPSLSIQALRNWHTPRIDLAVITNNRPNSLARLFHSLNQSIYLGDEVPLVVHLEQTADVVTQGLVSDFDWPHGIVTVRHRVVLGGLMPAIVESWYPANNDNYGVILEDDVEVSPQFYAWLKYSILHYRYSPKMREEAKRLFGISLYQQKNLELRPEGRRDFDARQLFEELGIAPTTPYRSQIPCSWGAAYFPEVWREFHAYLALRLSEISLEISDVIVPDIRSNRWPRSWKKYFIELVFLRGYMMLYPNYPEFASLSTNHMEMGTHIHVTAVDITKRLQFEVPLMKLEESLMDMPGGRLPNWQAMPTLDLWGQLSTEREIVERGWSGAAALALCARMWDLEAEPTYNARELLCRRNYISRAEAEAAAAAEAGQPAMDNHLANAK